MRSSSIIPIGMLAAAAWFVPGEAVAGMAQATESFATLQREQRRLVDVMQRAERRMPEVRFLAAQLDNIRSGLSMEGVDAIRARASGLERKLKDRRLKALFIACVQAMDGTRDVTETEKEAFLRLSVELDSSLAEVQQNGKRLKSLQTQLANVVPSEVKRKMLRQARDMLDAARARGSATDKAAALELEVELEQEACRLEPSRSRSQLRDLRGDLVIARKRVELLDAQTTLAETLQTALADDVLTDDERRELTRHQATFSQLKHSIAGMNTARY